MKLSDLITLPEKKSVEPWGEWEDGYNSCLSDLANMEIEIDDREVDRILFPYMRALLMGVGLRHEIKINNMDIESCDKIHAEIKDAIASQLPKFLKEKSNA